ncbi:hypothetical protein WJX72_003355 [[Myrmecia] bisecta]|uniref:N-acetyltransferase domain-containing protein n=1 Tax=[Myrmecia] bisecta TaxID=41462 RepID=A0AAW1Q0P0_9CHLO
MRSVQAQAPHAGTWTGLKPRRTWQQQAVISQRTTLGRVQRPHIVHADSHSPAAQKPAATQTFQKAVAVRPAEEQQPPVPSFQQVREAAAARGVHVTARSLGPFYRVVCRQGSEAGTILGLSSGFTVPPLRLMHCDSMQIFGKRLRHAEGVQASGLFGLGTIMVAAVFSFGYDCGCCKAELLAINDEDRQHKRLVKYYKRFGFVPLREVGNNGLRDLPDLLSTYHAF